MLIPRFHDVYDLLFAEIGQYPMKFLSATVAFELIDPEHLRELHRFAIPYVAEKADDGGDGQSKLAGDRGIGTAVPKPVDQGKEDVYKRQFLYKRLRGEMKFAGPSALVAQISRDSAAAREYLRENGIK